MDKQILRAIDANYNRAKEGLRVVEDIFRFIIQDDKLRRTARKIRHRLTPAICAEVIADAAALRSGAEDPGKSIDTLELKRKNIKNVLSANIARAKESLRALEEFFKLIDRKSVVKIKKLRYQTYDLEKEIIIKYHKHR